jgi:hypothetical protein
MNSKTTQAAILVALTICVGIYSSVTILMNPTGGIAGLSKLVTIICILVSLIKPRLGIMILVLQAIYNDQLKRLGVYYGAISMYTVQEILVGPLLTICALNVGVFMHVLFGKIKITKLGIALYLIAPLLGAYYLAGGGIGDTSFMKRAYSAGVAGLYTTIIPLCYFLFKDLRDWTRFVSFQTIAVVPSAIWAIWQYFNGFSDMEWAYARTGLSPVHSGQMLMFDNPRVFGFFGSASALGCLSLYCTYAFWRGFKISKYRWVFFGCGIIMLGALVVSTQRTALVAPLIFFFASAFTLRRTRIIVLYSSILIIFILGIWNATWLIESGLDKVNSMIASDSAWGREVLNVSTFSDRLRGWERLGQASSWTMFGSTLSESALLGEGEFANHDMFNRILMRVGAVGLFAILAAVGWLLWSLHKLVWALPKGLHKSAAALSLGTSVIVIFMSAAGGDNFTATPINLAIWSLFAGVFVIKRIHDSAKRPVGQHAANTQGNMGLSGNID